LNNLATLYRNGTGVPPDKAKAEQLYRKAADQGDAAARRNLDKLLEEDGARPPKDCPPCPAPVAPGNRCPIFPKIVPPARQQRQRGAETFDC